VPPPGQGNASGAYDKFGPGTRIPALLVSRYFEDSSVDHTQYDTTSILATIERRFDLGTVGGAYGAEGKGRDALVNDFSVAVRAARKEKNND
jgi:phospholipase C